MRSAGIYKLVICFVVVLLCGAYAFASDRFYSVQTGTYSLNMVKFAGKQFDQLSRELAGADRDSLRIVEGKQYFIVRVGRFEHREDALALLKRIRPLAGDAFVMKDSEESAVIRRYAQGDELPGKEKKKEDQVRTIPEEYYTLQIGNFLKLEQAKEEHASLQKGLSGEYLESLRIERVDRYFSVRLGRFPTLFEARRYRESQGDRLAGAIVMKAYGRDENIIGDEKKQKKRPSSLALGKASAVGNTTRDRFDYDEGERTKREVDALIEGVSSYYGNGDFGKAAELLRDGIERHPGDPDVRAWYGATLLNLRLPEKAYEQYEKAVELSPDVPDYHAGMGFSLLDIYMDKARSSIDAFQRALEIDPDNVNALEGLGVVYVSIDRKDEARELYLRLRELDPEAAERLNTIITYGLEWKE